VSANEAGETKTQRIYHPRPPDDHCCRAYVLRGFTGRAVS